MASKLGVARASVVLAYEHLPSLAFIVISGSFITILGMLIFTVIVYSKVKRLSSPRGS